MTVKLHNDNCGGGELLVLSLICQVGETIVSINERTAVSLFSASYLILQSLENVF